MRMILTFFFSGDNLCALQQHTNSWLSKLSEWLQVNKLELNIKKTKYIVFWPRNKCNDDILVIKFRDEVILRSTCHKFLGVTFEENLNWSSHVDSIKTSIARSIGIINKLKYLLPSRLKKQLYYSLVHSRLQYCLSVWGTTTKTNLDSLLTLQKRVIRIIENAPYRSHSAPLFEKNNILTIENLINKTTAVAIFQEIKLNETTFFKKYLPNEHKYTMRHLIYDKGKIRTNYGMQKQSFIVADFMNHHPAINTFVNESRSLGIFKKKVNMYLLSLQK